MHAGQEGDSPASPGNGAVARRRAVLWGAAKFLIGLGALVLLVRYIAPSWSEIRANVALDYPYFLLALLATGMATAAAAQRWRVLAELMGGARLPYAIYYHYFALTRLIGQFTSVAVMDAVGRGVAMSAAASEGPRLGQHIGALIVERLLDLILPMLTFACAVAWVKGWIELDPWVALAIVTGLFAVAAVLLLGPATRLVAVGFGWIQRLRHRETSVVAVRAPPALAARVTGLSLVRYAGVVVQFWATGALAGLSIDALTMTYATSVAQMTGFIGITPGGIGIQDAGWVGALTWLGLTGPVIAAYILVTRVSVVCIFAVLSLASFPFVPAKKRRDA